MRAKKDLCIPDLSIPDGYQFYDDAKYNDGKIMFTDKNQLVSSCAVDPETGALINGFLCQAQWCVQAVGNASWTEQQNKDFIPYTLCTAQNLNPNRIGEDFEKNARFYRCFALSPGNPKCFE